MFFIESLILVLVLWLRSVISCHFFEKMLPFSIKYLNMEVSFNKCNATELFSLNCSKVVRINLLSYIKNGNDTLRRDMCITVGSSASVCSKIIILTSHAKLCLEQVADVPIHVSIYIWLIFTLRMDPLIWFTWQFLFKTL